MPCFLGRFTTRNFLIAFPLRENKSIFASLFDCGGVVAAQPPVVLPEDETEGAASLASTLITNAKPKSRPAWLELPSIFSNHRNRPMRSFIEKGTRGHGDTRQITNKQTRPHRSQRLKRYVRRNPHGEFKDEVALAARLQPTGGSVRRPKCQGDRGDTI